MATEKQAIVTFKADASLLEALRGVPNRSAFIRSAVLEALANTCPLCHGSGMLTPKQKRHWQQFAADHAVTECDECHEFHLICQRSELDTTSHP
jgi:hypothetical protein